MLAACAMLIGCSGPAFEELFNNSGEELTVVLIDHDNYATTNHLRSGEVIRFGRLTEFDRLEIRGKNHVWHYKPAWAPITFTKPIGLGPRHLFQAQIEHDGSIYLLTPDSKPPVSHLPVQPENYPLRPVTESALSRS